MVCPRIFYTDLNRLRLLAGFGEAVFPAVPGVYWMEDNVEE
jgi:hypothetical protein